MAILPKFGNFSAAASCFVHLSYPCSLPTLPRDAFEREPSKFFFFAIQLGKLWKTPEKLRKKSYLLNGFVCVCTCWYSAQCSLREQQTNNISNVVEERRQLHRPTKRHVKRNGKFVENNKKPNFFLSLSIFSSSNSIWLDSTMMKLLRKSSHETVFSVIHANFIAARVSRMGEWATETSHKWTFFFFLPNSSPSISSWVEVKNLRDSLTKL